MPPEPVDAGREHDTDRHEENTQLRREYVACVGRVESAALDGDAHARTNAQRELDLIARGFVETNMGLVVKVVDDIVGLLPLDREDHQQAAMLGLWEAFVGTSDPTGDDDDTGWDPDRASFSSWATKHIRGRVLRSLHAHDATAVGLSYDMYSKRPQVRAAVEELTSTTGSPPSDAQVAETVEVTAATVHAVRRLAPLSLDADTYDQRRNRLVDELADLTNELDDGPTQDEAEQELVRRIKESDVGTVDLLAYVLRSGIAGGAAQRVDDSAWMLGVGRGRLQNGIKRVEKTLELKPGGFDGVENPTRTDERELDA